MRIINIRQQQKGSAIPAIIGVVVVVLIITVGAVVLGKSSGTKKEASGNTAIVGSSTSKQAGNKQIKDIKFSGEVAAAKPEAQTADAIKAANEAQVQYYGKQIFTTTGGYRVTLNDKVSSVLWGTSPQPVKVDELKMYFSKTVQGSGEDIDLKVTTLPGQTVKTSDGKSQEASCFGLTATSDSQSFYSAVCSASIQAGTVLISTQGTSEQEAADAMKTFIADSTIELS